MREFAAPPCVRALVARGLTVGALQYQWRGLQGNDVLAGDKIPEGDAEEQKRAGRKWGRNSWFCLLGSLASLGSLLRLFIRVGGGGGAQKEQLATQGTDVIRQGGGNQATARLASPPNQPSGSGQFDELGSTRQCSRGGLLSRNLLVQQSLP